MTALSLAIDTPELAQHYETVSADRQFRHGLELLERLGLSKGQRVLDIGCGTGLLAEYAASVVAPSGAVVGIDPLPLRIEGLSYPVSDTELRELLTRAGFQVDVLDLVPHATHHSSAEAALHFAQASSFGNYLGRIPSELRGAAERDILAEFERLREPQGVPQQGTRFVAVAHKPASH